MNAQRHKKAGAAGACPLRTCIVSRVAQPPDNLIRFALSPDNEVVPDVAHKLPGRGAWLSNSRKVLEVAVSRRAFDRAWRRQVRVADDLIDRVDTLLVRRALDALSLANKSGCVITGFTNVEKRVEAAESMVLVQACDASIDGRERLARKYRAICGANQVEPLIIDLFSVGQISLAIGRPNVVHAAIDREGVACGFIRAAQRVVEFRTAGEPLDSGLIRSDTVESPSEKANDVGRETEQV